METHKPLQLFHPTTGSFTLNYEDTVPLSTYPSAESSTASLLLKVDFDGEKRYIRRGSRMARSLLYNRGGRKYEYQYAVCHRLGSMQGRRYLKTGNPVIAIPLAAYLGEWGCNHSSVPRTAEEEYLSGFLWEVNDRRYKGERSGYLASMLEMRGPEETYENGCTGRVRLFIYVKGGTYRLSASEEKALEALGAEYLASL